MWCVVWCGLHVKGLWWGERQLKNIQQVLQTEKKNATNGGRGKFGASWGRAALRCASDRLPSQYRQFVRGGIGKGWREDANLLVGVCGCRSRTGGEWR